MRAGHDVRATDLTRPQWDRLHDPREAEDYVQADLTDAGACHALVRGCDAVVHTAAIPQPTHNPPHVVFENNLLATFNLLEAAIAAGIPRFVNFSSETVPGCIFAYRRSSRTICRSTRTTRSARRIRTRPRSGSASC